MYMYFLADIWEVEYTHTYSFLYSHLGVCVLGGCLCEKDSERARARETERQRGSAREKRRSFHHIVKPFWAHIGTRQSKWVMSHIHVRVTHSCAHVSLLTHFYKPSGLVHSNMWLACACCSVCARFDWCVCTHCVAVWHFCACVASVAPSRDSMRACCSVCTWLDWRICTHCVAVCCSALRCVAVCCRVLPCVATCRLNAHTLQCMRTIRLVCALSLHMHQTSRRKHQNI